MTDPTPAPVPAPCAADDAVSTIYDPAAYGRCANGHPLNRAGRCPAVNGLALGADGLWWLQQSVATP